MAEPFCPGCNSISRRSGRCDPRRRAGAFHAAVSALDPAGSGPGPALSVAVHLAAGTADRAGAGAGDAGHGPGAGAGRLPAGAAPSGPAGAGRGRPVPGDAGPGGAGGGTAAPAAAPGGGSDPGGLLPGGHGQQCGDADRPGRRGPLGGDDHLQHPGGGAAHPAAHRTACRPLCAGGWLEAAAGRAAGGAAAGGPGAGPQARGASCGPPPGAGDAALGGAGHRADCGQHRGQPAPGAAGAGPAAAAGGPAAPWRRLLPGLADPRPAGPTPAGAPHHQHRGGHAELRPGRGAGPLRLCRLAPHRPARGDLGGGACGAWECAGELVEGQSSFPQQLA